MTARSVSKHVPRYHYALLLASTDTPLPIDRPTLVQLLQKELGEWFGTTGGVNPNEVEIVTIQPLQEKQQTSSRNVVLRFPRS
ncbi:hypothetical protein JCM16303_005541 [Sporobolomyces ruberrimus]